MLRILRPRRSCFLSTNTTSGGSDSLLISRRLSGTSWNNIRQNPFSNIVHFVLPVHRAYTSTIGMALSTWHTEQYFSELPLLPELYSPKRNLSTIHCANNLQGSSNWPKIHNYLNTGRSRSRKLKVRHSVLVKWLLFAQLCTTGCHTLNGGAPAKILVWGWTRYKLSYANAAMKMLNWADADTFFQTSETLASNPSPRSAL